MKRVIVIIWLSVFANFINAQSILSVMDSVQLSDADIWGNIAFNGTNVSVTTTSHVNTLSYLYLRKLDSDMNQIGTRVQLTFDSDPETAQKITDHKMLYLNGHHFITFMVANNDLYLMKADSTGQRVGTIVPVVENTTYPTNDMFFTTDSTFIYVGYFKPPGQTIFRTFDQNLNAIGDSILTDPSQYHNNIGSVIFYNNQFHMFTGTNLGHNTSLLYTQWFADWGPVQSQGRMILNTANGDGNDFSTGLVLDLDREYWIIAFHHLTAADTLDEQHIDIAVFDINFILLERHHVTGKETNRPGLVLWGDNLYLVYDQVGTGVFMKKFSIQEIVRDPVEWKCFFTLDPDEGIAFSFPENYLVHEGGVPVMAITPDEDMVLSYSGGAEQSGSFLVNYQSATYDSVTGPSGRAADGGIIYLPDGRLRFIGEENAPNSTREKRRSRIVSSISYDGIHWTRESGIRYQPGAEDDSISSVPSVIQVQDSIWRMYYVGDFYRTNGTRTAISYDWGLTWQQESVNNILRKNDVDPHAVYLSNGQIRLYHRHMTDPGGIAYTDGDGLVFDTTHTTMLIPDGTLTNYRKLDPWVIKYPNDEIACFIGASPKFQGQGVNQLVVAFAEDGGTEIESHPLSSGPPETFTLFPNVPNPFNPSTMISLWLTVQSQTRIDVYNALGQKVDHLFTGELDMGYHEILWDASGFPSGVYFFVVESDLGVLRRKCLLLK